MTDNANCCMFAVLQFWLELAYDMHSRASIQNQGKMHENHIETINMKKEQPIKFSILIEYS